MFIKVKPYDNQMKKTEDMNQHTDSFFKIIRIFLLLGGMFPGEQTGKRSCSSTIKKALIGLMWIICTGNLIVIFTAMYFRASKSGEMTRLIGSALTFLSFIYINVLYSFLMPTSLQDLQKAYQSYESTYGFKPYFIKWIKRLKVLVVITPVSAICSGLLWPFIVKKFPTIECDMYPVCNFSEPFASIGYITTAAAPVIVSLQWQISVIIFAIWANVLRQEFHSNSNMFKELSEAKFEDQESKFKDCVRQHGTLMVLLGRSSDLVQHGTFVSIFMYLPQACFFIYAAIAKPSEEMAFLCIGMLWSLIMVGSRIILEASVSLKLNLFVSRLTGESIGYSIYGLFTVNMPAILGIIGTLVTYIIIVVQFRPTSSECEILMKNMTY